MSTNPVEVALHLANLVSPTGKEQDGFISMVEEMRQNAVFDHDIVLAICDKIVDGSRYGNWPQSSD